MKRFLAGAVALIVVAAYAAGYWPGHQQRIALEAEAAALRSRLEQSAAFVRADRRLGRLLDVPGAAASLKFGQAQTRVAALVDEGRAGIARTPVGRLRQALNELLPRRDSVTGALGRAEPAVAATLRALPFRLRRALGYSVPPVEEPPSTGLPPSP